ncbi:MAG: cyclodeaminase/cyclohydrolase family protein [Thermoplasmata archaeon]|nr:cyclodeaminase/cyclohydrolase family protein [Thermoplasmata archaeon]
MGEDKKGKGLVDLTLAEFLEELASDSPAPGGGSVAALSGALAAALASMVANLTIGKKKYEDSQDMMLAVRGRAAKLRRRLLEIVDEDTEAFNMVMAAYRTPKDNPDRGARIQEALKKAVEPPLEVVRISKEIIELARVVAEKGNQNSITDAGAAVLMADAALQVAAMNVKINLQSIKDQEFVDETERKLGGMEFEAVDLVDEALRPVLAVVDPKALEEGGSGRGR